MEPLIRFSDFNNGWESTSLGNLFKERNERNSNKELLSVTMHQGVIKANANGRHNNSSDDRSSYKYVDKGDIAYNSMRMWQGACGCSKYEGIVSPAYTVIIPSASIVPDFFIRLFKSKKTLKKFRLNSQGLTSDTWNLKYQTLSKILVDYPCSHIEQQAISDYFDNIDTLIANTSARLASLKQVKEASLQAMFPQEGETAPKIRFKGFDGEWKKVKLGTLFSERTENDINGEMLSVTMHDGIIKASENGRFDNSNSDKSNYKLVLENDIAYNSMRMWQGASGCSPYRGIVSPAYTVITPYEDVNSSFFACYFKTTQMIEKFRLHSQGLTKDTWNLKFPAFSKITVTYPQSVNEQQAIASYFTALDKQISLQIQRLEKLKQIKSACLDKMFV